MKHSRLRRRLLVREDSWEYCQAGVRVYGSGCAGLTVRVYGCAGAGGLVGVLPGGADGLGEAGGGGRGRQHPQAPPGPQVQHR
eukprot:817871-Pyramimonas_sp.AAC.1